MEHTKLLPDEYLLAAEEGDAKQAVADYIAGMTDRYAVRVFEALFLPKGWERL